MSGGMKQKLALSCALVHRPELLILDEPTYGVDPVSRQEFWQMLKSIQKGGTSILVSTPYMDEAELCDRVTLIYNGKVLASDTPTKIKANWNKVVFRVTSPEMKELEPELVKIIEIESCQRFGNELHLVLQADEAASIINQLETRFDEYMPMLEQIQPGMEDIYLSYMQAVQHKEPSHAG